MPFKTITSQKFIDLFIKAEDKYWYDPVEMEKSHSLDGDPFISDICESILDVLDPEMKISHYIGSFGSRNEIIGNYFSNKVLPSDIIISEEIRSLAQYIDFQLT